MAHWMNMLPHKKLQHCLDLPNSGRCMCAQTGFLHDCIIGNCHMLTFKAIQIKTIEEPHWLHAVSSHKEASEAEVFQWSLVTMATEIQHATGLFSLQTVVVWVTQSKHSRTMVKWSRIMIMHWQCFNTRLKVDCWLDAVPEQPNLYVASFGSF